MSPRAFFQVCFSNSTESPLESPSANVAADAARQTSKQYSVIAAILLVIESIGSVSGLVVMLPPSAGEKDVGHVVLAERFRDLTCPQHSR